MKPVPISIKTIIKKWTWLFQRNLNISPYLLINNYLTDSNCIILVNSSDDKAEFTISKYFRFYIFVMCSMIGFCFNDLLNKYASEMDDEYFYISC